MRTKPRCSHRKGNNISNKAEWMKWSLLKSLWISLLAFIMDETHPVCSWAGSSIVPPPNSRTFHFPDRRTVPTKKLTPCPTPPSPHPTFCPCTWLYGPHLEPHLIPLRVFVLLYLDIVKGPHTLGRTCQYSFLYESEWYTMSTLMYLLSLGCLSLLSMVNGNWFWAGCATTINLWASVANSPCGWTSRSALHPPTGCGYFFGNMKTFNAELL